MNRSMRAITTLIPFTAIGCGGPPLELEGEPEETSNVSIELEIVPPGVRCIMLGLNDQPQDPNPEIFFHDVIPGRAAVLSLPPLSSPPRTGRLYGVFGSAWETTCDDPARGQAEWETELVEFEVRGGVQSHVQLDFYRHEAPVVDANFVQNLKRLVVGSRETYAILADGTAWQWGALGGDSGNISTTPRRVSSFVAVEQIALGSFFGCLLRTDGGVRCWGFNGSGQLGPSVSHGEYRAVPVNVPLPSTGKAEHISAGNDHVCAVLTSGELACWGHDGDGRTGPQQDPPLDINLPQWSVARVSAGLATTCTFGGAQPGCFGSNVFGLYGDGTTVSSPALQQLPLKGIVDLALGWFHACAVLADGGVRCWGDNRVGQLGDGSFTSSTVPVTVGFADGQPLEGIVQITAGASHTCAVREDGELFCWGANDRGQVGRPDAMPRNRPEPRFIVEQVSAGGHSTCFQLPFSLEIQCWGANDVGQLGDGTREDRFDPVSIKF